MKLLKSLFFVLIFFAAANNFILAQSYSGIVADAITKQPIGYVNIGVVGKGIGTVSDMNGHFSITLNDSLNNQLVRFSCIGYTPQSFAVSTFKSTYSNNCTVLLNTNTFALHEVVVKPKAYKTVVLGNTSTSKFLSLGAESNDLGSEMGTLMHIKKAPTFIENVNFNFSYIALDSVKFRLNIYSVKDGMPDTIILKQPIFITTKIKSGTLSVDVKKYDLVAMGDFVVSLELIEDYGKNKILVCGGLLNSDCFFRKTSQDKWKKAGLLGVSFNSTVSYQQ